MKGRVVTISKKPRSSKEGQGLWNRRAAPGFLLGVWWGLGFPSLWSVIKISGRDSTRGSSSISIVMAHVFGFEKGKRKRKGDGIGKSKTNETFRLSEMNHERFLYLGQSRAQFSSLQESSKSDTKSPEKEINGEILEEEIHLWS